MTTARKSMLIIHRVLFAASLVCVPAFLGGCAFETTSTGPGDHDGRTSGISGAPGESNGAGGTGGTGTGADRTGLGVGVALGEDPQPAPWTPGQPVASPQPSPWAGGAPAPGGKVSHPVEGQPLHSIPQ